MKDLTLSELERQVARTQGFGVGSVSGVPDRLRLSLIEECAEVVRVLEEIQGLPRPKARGRGYDLILELGDVLNVVTAIALHAGFSLAELAMANDAKLRRRWPEPPPEATTTTKAKANPTTTTKATKATKAKAGGPCPWCGGELFRAALGELGPGAKPPIWEGLDCRSGCAFGALGLGDPK